jgi:hypothetical protein
LGFIKRRGKRNVSIPGGSSTALLQVIIPVPLVSLTTGFGSFFQKILGDPQQHLRARLKIDIGAEILLTSKDVQVHREAINNAEFQPIFKKIPLYRAGRRSFSMALLAGRHFSSLSTLGSVDDRGCGPGNSCRRQRPDENESRSF